MVTCWFPVLLLTASLGGCVAADQRQAAVVESRLSASGTSASVSDNTPWPVVISGLREAVAIDAVPGQNRIFIIEQGRHRLLVLDEEGLRLDSLGVRGRSDYRLDTPVSLDATNGLQLFISDRNNGRIQRYDRRLSYLSTVSPDRSQDTQGFFRPGPIAVNTFGDLFVADTDSGELLWFDQNGRLQLRTDLRDTDMMLPLRSMIAQDDVLFVLESQRGLVHELGSQGSWRRFLAGTEGTQALAADRDGFWIMGPTELMLIGWQGSVLFRKNHGISDHATGIAAGRDALFVLTRTHLYRIPRSRLQAG